jgi:integrase
MEQFVAWYCPEPRLALNRTVVLRFRLHLESPGLAAGTVNQRLAAVRRLAYEAADSGLLGPELAAGIRRVKGAKQFGARTGNWLTRDQARLLLEKADGDDLRSVRDLAMISVLIGCGLRRAELSALTVEDMQNGLRMSGGPDPRWASATCLEKVKLPAERVLHIDHLFARMQRLNTYEAKTNAMTRIGSNLSQVLPPPFSCE